MALPRVQQTKIGFIENVDLYGNDGTVALPVSDDHTIAESKPDFKSFLLGGPKFDDIEIERELDYGREIDL